MSKRLSGALLVVALACRAVFAADLAQLPDYAARRLGETGSFDLRSLRDHAVMVNTWATWCGPCRTEMPGMDALSRRYAGRGLAVVGVNVDEGRADDTVVDYVRSMGLSFVILRDPANHFAKEFRTLGVPETLLFDRAGKLVHRWRGEFDTQADDTRSLIETALATNAAPELLEQRELWAAQRMASSKVDTDKDGVVWLSGNVSNQHEADRAVAIARETEGARSVNSDIMVKLDR